MQTSDYEEPIEAPNRCSECGSRNLVTTQDTLEVVCRDCGTVLTTVVANRDREWRAFSYDEHQTRTRTGPPLDSRIEKPLTTYIPQNGIDTNGNLLDLETRRQMRRISRWNNRVNTFDSRDRNFRIAQTDLLTIRDNLNIPNGVYETSLFVYRKALDASLIRGRTIKDIALAAMYMACRINDHPISITEFAEKGDLKKKDLARCYRLLIRNLDIDIPNPQEKQRIKRIANKLEMNLTVQQYAYLILQEAKRLRSTIGKDPKGLAAAALYLAQRYIDSGEKPKTQEEIANEAKTTEVTVRNRYKGLINDLGEEKLLEIRDHLRGSNFYFSDAS